MRFAQYTVTGPIFLNSQQFDHPFHATWPLGNLLLECFLAREDFQQEHIPSHRELVAGAHLCDFSNPGNGLEHVWTDMMRQVRNYTEERTTEYNETVEFVHCNRLNGSNGSNSSNSTQEKCQRVNTTEVRLRSINVSLVVWFESHSLSQYRCIASPH